MTELQPFQNFGFAPFAATKYVGLESEHYICNTYSVIAQKIVGIKGRMLYSFKMTEPFQNLDFLEILSIKYVSRMGTGQNQNFEMAITQSYLKPKCMKKSANIEKDLFSLNLPKKFKKYFAYFGKII